MTIDPYSICLLIVMTLTAILVRRDALRVEGVLFLLSLMLVTIGLQNASDTVAPVAMLASLDLFGLVYFSWIAYSHNCRILSWPFAVVLAFLSMLAVHTSKVVMGFPDNFWYVSSLNFLTYVCLASISAGVVAEIWRAVRDRYLDRFWVSDLGFSDRAQASSHTDEAAKR